MKRIILAIALSLASVLAVAKPLTVINPVVVTSTVPESASGYWYSQQVPGLKFSVIVGSYYASTSGLGGTCGKLLKVTASIPRTAGTSTWQYAEGATYDSNNNGIPYGTSFSLLTRAAVAGTISVVGYDSVNNYLTVQLNTPVGGPSGTLTLNRDPLVPYTAAIVPNCN